MPLRLPLLVRRPAHLLCCAALVLVGSSCSGTDDDGGEDAATPSAPSEPATDPATEEAGCTVAGFVPENGKTLTGARPVVVYAATIARPPDTPGLVRPVTLGRAAVTRVDVRDSEGEPVEESRLLNVLGAFPGPVVDGVLPEESRVRVRLPATGDRNEAHVVYRVGRQARGTWHSDVCGAPDNDGTEVTRLRGTFRTVIDLRQPRVHRCSQDTGGDPVLEQVARLACR